MHSRPDGWLLVQTAGDLTDAIDVRPEALALQRLTFRELPAVPGFARVEAVHEHGVRVTASVRGGTDGTVAPLFAGQRAIALAQANLDADGTFVLPEIAPGAYRLKLLSAFAGPDPNDAVFTTGAPVPVVFNAAPLVNGKLELAAGGATSEPATVTLLRSGEVTSAVPDVSSWIVKRSSDRTAHSPPQCTSRERTRCARGGGTALRHARS